MADIEAKKPFNNERFCSVSGGCEADNNLKPLGFGDPLWNEIMKKHTPVSSKGTKGINSEDYIEHCISI